MATCESLSSLACLCSGHYNNSKPVSKKDKNNFKKLFISKSKFSNKHKLLLNHLIIDAVVNVFSIWLLSSFHALVVATTRSLVFGIQCTIIAATVVHHLARMVVDVSEGTQMIGVALFFDWKLGETFRTMLLFYEYCAREGEIIGMNMAVTREGVLRGYIVCAYFRKTAFLFLLFEIGITLSSGC